MTRRKKGSASMTVTLRGDRVMCEDVCTLGAKVTEINR